MAMERFRRASSPPERTRSGLLPSGDGLQGRKKPTIGRAAESFQSKLMASLRSVTRRGLGDELSQGARYGNSLLSNSFGEAQC